MPKIALQSQLTLFDVTNLVVGAIIGADIYVASTFGAQYLGPFSLIVWVIAGLMAIVFLQIFGVSISGAWTYWLVENTALWILALSVVGAWSYHNRKEVKAKLNTSAPNQN